MAYGVQSHGQFFPRAAAYPTPPTKERLCLREPEGRRRDFPWTERHLQCVWYDPALRPPGLRTAAGENVDVEDPGVWNLEAGPDFLGARLRVGGRRLAGDVEVHVHPRDWLQHGHADDPRYHRVRVHLTYFPGALNGRDLPAGIIQVSLKNALAAQPQFSFEVLDLTAYPYAARATPAPCSLVLREWDADRKIALLESAGEERLRRKAERLAAAIHEKGREQALYEEALAALGYKHNKGAFRGLAERVPVDALREAAGPEVLTAYAVLAGVAGLLPDQPSRQWDAETRTFIREAWDRWWKPRARWEGVILPRSSWRLAGLRPANRPERRLMAAACLFTHRPGLADEWIELAERFPEECIDRIIENLQVISNGYWDRHLTWGGRRQAQPAALVGESLARAMVNNIVVPFLAACEMPQAFERGLLRRLPVESGNQVVNQTAHSLFGPDYPPSYLRDGLRQQGLIQIFHDYCLNDRSRCATCNFPAFLGNS
ncbi:MAG: DUF2851 family protein [Kiritimatiellae bacterium]|nr:DUF2851 family protein [Kiritimatiellia bacterium]